MKYHVHVSIFVSNVFLDILCGLRTLGLGNVSAMCIKLGNKRLGIDLITDGMKEQAG